VVIDLCRFRERFRLRTLSVEFNLSDNLEFLT